MKLLHGVVPSRTEENSSNEILEPIIDVHIINLSKLMQWRMSHILLWINYETLPTAGRAILTERPRTVHYLTSTNA